jgi:hypothetical protein
MQPVGEDLSGERDSHRRLSIIRRQKYDFLAIGFSWWLFALGYWVLAGKLRFLSKNSWQKDIQNSLLLLKRHY